MLAISDARPTAIASMKPSPEMLGLIEYRTLTDLLNVTRPTLDRLSKTPGFPRRIRLGRLHYVKLAGIREWVDAR